MTSEGDVSAVVFDGSTELLVVKEEFKFNAAHFVVLEVSGDASRLRG